MNTDTIAAIATAMANSGIGIIRMSGNAAIEIADKVFRSKSNQSLKDCKSHTIHYGYIMNEDEVMDEVLVMIMKAPNSYTRENTIEINCHGGVLVMQKILETVMKYGARPAEPGEFTKRAFLNGRIDLAQAESVLIVIDHDDHMVGFRQFYGLFGYGLVDILQKLEAFFRISQAGPQGSGVL